MNQMNQAMSVCTYMYPEYQIWNQVNDYKSDQNHLDRFAEDIQRNIQSTVDCSPKTANYCNEISSHEVYKQIYEGKNRDMCQTKWWTKINVEHKSMFVIRNIKTNGRCHDWFHLTQLISGLKASGNISRVEDFWKRNIKCTKRILNTNISIMYPNSIRTL